MRYLAEHALIGSAIVDDVLITVDPTGIISAVGNPDGQPAERLSGLVVPGMPNLHSHAFQRAMAGLTERASPDGDDFWQWRDVMYRFLAHLTPDDMQAIAAQVFIECLRHGYTAIAEFHYVHNQPDGAPYDDPAELSWRILAAAEDSGIGLTMLPVLYRHGGFGGRPSTAGQRRFILAEDAYAALLDRLASRTSVGVAPHSLRAVTPEQLTRMVALAGGRPIHIHAAEQEKEVADCLAHTGARPIAWLLANQPVDPRWCIVHATHMTPAETAALARTGAVAGLCQTTEANLGDGIFPLADYLAAGGRFGIGGDSHVGTNPAEELRWLECIRRLAVRRRNATLVPPGISIGTTFYTQATAGGAQALGRQAGRIAAGHLADLVVLDTQHPALIGCGRDGWIDGWLFSGTATPVRHVMVAGRWVIRDGHHAREDTVLAAYRQAMARHAVR